MRTKFLNGRAALIGSILFFVSILCYNSKSLSVTTEDQAYIHFFLQDWQLNQPADSIHQNFESEVRFISAVQDSIIAQLKHEEVPHSCFGDVDFYYRYRKGFCYDRAALMEKLFSYYGFPYRHIYVYFGKDGKGSTISNFFQKGTASHALLEVKTQKGWMTVGTNANWLGLTKENEPLTIGQLRHALQESTLKLEKPATRGPVFWERSHYFRYVYGIYSRHGDFFDHPAPMHTASLLPPGHFLPDYNLKMLLYNLVRKG